MKNRKESDRSPARRKLDRMGRSSVMVAVALIAVVGVVGAGTYAVLNSIGLPHSAPTSTTNTTSTCHPSTAPECRGLQHPGEVITPVVALGASRV